MIQTQRQAAIQADFERYVQDYPQLKHALKGALSKVVKIRPAGQFCWLRGVSRALMQLVNRSARVSGGAPAGGKHPDQSGSTGGAISVDPYPGQSVQHSYCRDPGCMLLHAGARHDRSEGTRVCVYCACIGHHDKCLDVGVRVGVPGFRLGAEESLTASEWRISSFSASRQRRR